jgi:hypothetical protein
MLNFIFKVEQLFILLNLQFIESCKLILHFFLVDSAHHLLLNQFFLCLLLLLLFFFLLSDYFLDTIFKVSGKAQASFFYDVLKKLNVSPFVFQFLFSLFQ